MHVSSGTGNGSATGRVAVIGFDGAVPDLAFDRYADRIPASGRRHSRPVPGSTVLGSPPRTKRTGASQVLRHL